MSDQNALEEILLLDASMIAFEREKWAKESQDLQLHIKAMASKALTSFDRQRLEDLEAIAKKRQLLGARQERYFDGLNEVRMNKDKQRMRPAGYESVQPMRTGVLEYLVQERDSIIQEVSRLRAETARLLDDGTGRTVDSSRPNLMRNPNGGSLLRAEAPALSQSELHLAKKKKVQDTFEVVENIERVRQGANSMANTDKRFLQSLDSVLEELRADYLKTKDGQSVGMSRSDSRADSASAGGREPLPDSLDALKDRDGSVSDLKQTRDSGFRHKRSASDLTQLRLQDPHMGLALGPTDPITQKKLQLMNLEKALAFDERLQEMNFSRKKLDLDLVAANTHLRQQDFLLQNYQDLMHEKNLLRKELASEVEAMRRDRLDARKHLLEVRNLRAELEADKRKAFLDRRARDLQASKKDMLAVVTNYLDYKSYASDRAPFPRQFHADKLAAALDSPDQ